MTTPNPAALVDYDLLSAGQAWLQDNEDKYIYTRLPRLIVNRIDDDYTGVTTYPLIKLNTGMPEGGGLAEIAPGVSVGDGEGIDTDTVTVTVRQVTTKPLVRNMGSKRPRVADMAERQRIALARLFNGVGKKLAEFLQNTTAHGSARTFAGNALSDLTDIANQAPHLDIEVDLNDIRQYQGGGLLLICIMDTKAMDVLRTRPEYTGAGVGSNSASLMPEADFLARFKSAHRLDDVWVLDARGNIAAYGATKTITHYAGTAGIGGLLWFGLIDGRGGSFDLTVGAGDPQTNCDGALAFAAPEGDYDSWVSPNYDTRQEILYCTRDVGFVAPRSGGTMSFFYTPAEVTTI